jgi:hypothetical protein
MSDEKEHNKLLPIQTAEGFGEKALPQLLSYLESSGYVVIKSLNTPFDINDDEKYITFNEGPAGIQEDTLTLSEDFLSGLIFFCNSVHHSMKLIIQREDVSEDLEIPGYENTITIQMTPKPHNEVF